MAAAMDCTCWTEDGCMTGANWRLWWGLLEASLLSWWPRLVALDLVRTIQPFVVGQIVRQILPTDGANWWTQWNQWLNVLGINDQRALESLKKQTQNQRRPRKTGQESSYGKVSIFGIPIFMEVCEWLTLLLMSAYIARLMGQLLI